MVLPPVAGVSTVVIIDTAVGSVGIVGTVVGAMSSLEACERTSAGSEGTCTRGSKSVKHLGGPEKRRA